MPCGQLACPSTFSPPFCPSVWRFPLEDDPAGGLVVLLRLKSGRPLRTCGQRDGHIPLAKHACVQHLLEDLPRCAAWRHRKSVTRCCRIGGVRTFWRFGVLVKSGLGDVRDDSEIFAVVLEFLSTSNELNAQVYGDISNLAPWAALSFVISAVRFMLLEFPGLRSNGVLLCPQHGDSMPLSNTMSR